MQSGYARALIGALLIAAFGCGGGSPTTPQTQTVNLTGTWTGTLETSNYPALNVSLQLTQTGSGVTGTWASTPTGAWSGNVSAGQIQSGTFTGAFSLTARSTNDAVTCSSSATFTGPVAASGDIRWTSSGFAATGCVNPPANVVIRISR